jgi:hypothetical protein
MEELVALRKDLSWDGWDVVRTFGKASFFDKDAIYINGTWVKKKVYPITEKGWEVPNSIGDANAKMER